MHDAPPVDDALIRFAVDIAREAGELTLGWFRQSDLTVEGKSDGRPEVSGTVCVPAPLKTTGATASGSGTAGCTISIPLALASRPAKKLSSAAPKTCDCSRLMQ